MHANKLNGTLEAAVCMMAIAPMLVVLFMVVLMRALKMDPINGPPKKWVQNCSYACIHCINFQGTLAIAVPSIMNGKAKKRTKGKGAAAAAASAVCSSPIS